MSARHGIKLPGHRRRGEIAEGEPYGILDLHVWKVPDRAEVGVTLAGQTTFVNSADLRAAVEYLVSVVDMVGITYSGGERVR